jgi:hypothetical protein
VIGRKKHQQKQIVVAKSDYYVVVCSDFHGAVGPFSTIQGALAEAKKRTAETDCVYIPVALEFLGKVVSIGGKTLDDVHRGYL